MDHFINTNVTDLASARSVSLLTPTPRPFPVLAYGDAGTDRFFFHNDGTIESWSGDATYGLRVTLGDVNAGPFGGTYTLTSTSTTTALAYDTDADALETALNQLTGISAAGGVDVSGTFPNFLVSYRAVGVVATAITANGALLTPDSGIGVTVLTTGDASTRQLTALTFRRQPICSVTSWTPISSPYDGWSGTLTTNTEGALALLQHEGEQVGEFVQAVTIVQVEVLDPAGQYLTRYQAPFTLRAKNIDIASTSATPLPSIVTSVGLALPSIFTVSGSPVTSTGTLTATLATQTANTIFAGPTTGSPAAPTFRAMVNADVPSALTGKSYNGLTLTSTTGTLTIADLKTLTVSNSLTFTGTDGSTLNVGAGGTLSLGGTLTTGGAFTTSGAFGLTLTATALTNVTLPTTGTLATRAGSEALTNKTYNGLTVTTTTGTLTLTNGKTLSVANTLSFAGTDGTTMTFPTTTATIARTDAGQTFTGTQVISTINSPSGQGLSLGTGTSGVGITIRSSNSFIGIGTLVPDYPLVIINSNNGGSISSGGDWSLGAIVGTFAAGTGSASLDAIIGVTASSRHLRVVGWTGATNAERARFEHTTLNFVTQGNVSFAVSGRGVIGTATNDSADAGNVGQIVSSLVASGSAASLTTATAANITSISLPAGDWDVSGNVDVTLGSATLTAQAAGISTTSATLPSDGSEVYSGLQLTTTSAVDSMPVPRKRISISGTTTVYLVGRCTFTAGTAAAFGAITARRVR